jgi:hypothetical protein
MKISPVFNHSRKTQNGSAVLIVMGLVAIMGIFVAVNIAAIRTLDRELKMLDHRQIRRIQPSINHPANSARHE